MRKQIATRVSGRDGFDYPATLQGSTAHFNVYYDAASLGATGATIADGVLATCEGDYATMSWMFGGITPPGLPFNIVVAPLDPSGNGGGGAYHYGCSAVDLYCDAKTNPGVDIDYTRFLLVAEATEVFEAALANGWDCGASNGEGLSRVVATAMYPAELDGYTTAAAWLDNGRPDWIDSTESTDQDPVANGCAVLFLNWLHKQLDFTWPEIIAAGGSTLAQTYQNLTGQSDALTPFSDLMAAWYPIGTPSGVTTDDPFPLLDAIGFPLSGVQFQGTVGVGSTASWYTFGWPVRWNVQWNVVPTNQGATEQLSWTVSVQKASGSDSTFFTYWINITNLSDAPVDVEARYCVPAYV